MKILFMGTPDYAAAALAALLESGAPVGLVVTQPDRPKGRKGELVPPPVKVCAEAHQVPVLQPEHVRDPETMEQLKNFAPDLCIVAAFGQILPAELLKLPPLGCVNLHASLLPKLRGASPIQQALIDGEKETGITLMQMAEGVDTGDILLQHTIPIAAEDTGGSLFEKLSSLAARTIVEALPALEAGTLTPVPQKEELATYCRKLTKQMGRVDWRMGAENIERLIRALDPWPSCYTTLGGRTLKLWRADVLPDARSAEGAPGTITEITGDSIRVLTGDGILEIRELQLEGKKRMLVHDFLLGYRLQAGEILG
ncbi:MAG: methionyl-tRNA formyltransferase [Butyrivibrio sp.]|nr:methionyl-tRNA formyltransferase [Butyrivibrio sp.]